MWRWIAIVAVSLLVVAAVAFAATTIFAPPKVEIDTTPYTFVAVTEGAVGDSLALNAEAEWKARPAGTNQASGTVTSVEITNGQQVDVGTVLYTVNLRPVAIARGDVPAFRPLTRGDLGADVAQLQGYLAARGLYAGAADGSFGLRTSQAVRAWQKQIGVPADGVVQAGDLVYVPSLPARVTLDDERVVRGASLTGGEALVSALAATPDFSMSVTESQSSLMPDGTPVELTGPDGATWRAVTGARVSEGGAVTIQLVSSTEAPICEAECGSVSPIGKTLIESRVIIVPEVVGYVAPTAALLSQPDGSLSVVTDTGSVLPVKVLASSRGQAVIEGDGVDLDLRVRIPAQE